MICATEKPREERKLLTVGTRLLSKWVGEEAEIIEVVAPGSQTADGVENTTNEVWYRQEFIQDGSKIWGTLDGFVVLAPKNPLDADTDCAELGDVVLVLDSGGKFGHYFDEGSIGIVVDYDQAAFGSSEYFAVIEQHRLNGAGDYVPLWQTLPPSSYAVVQVPSA